MAFAGADSNGMYTTYEQKPRQGNYNRGQEGNVLLCSIEDMTYPVTIEDIHRVFSLCGFVCKISTFEKAAGFQVLVQYADVPTAVNAQQTLEGYNIFEGCCRLRISFSRHTDLNVRFNSDRSRDYTVGMPGGTDPAAFSNSGGGGGGADGGGRVDAPSNVLLVSVEEHLYQLTIPVIQHVFQSYGTVHKCALFEKKGGFQILIQMASVDDASRAKAALDGHQVYEGCCRLRVSFSQHTNLNVKRNSDTTWDYTNGALDNVPDGAPQANAAVAQGPPSSYITPEVFAAQSKGLPADYMNDVRWGLYTSLNTPGALDPRLYFTPVDAQGVGAIEAAAVAAGFAANANTSAPPMAQAIPMADAAAVAGAAGAANAAVFGDEP